MYIFSRFFDTLFMMEVLMKIFMPSLVAIAVFSILILYTQCQISACLPVNSIPRSNKCLYRAPSSG